MDLVQHEAQIEINTGVIRQAYKYFKIQNT